LQAKQARATVLRALERIPLRRRAVLVMHELEEVPMAQVARVLSIPLFTAYSRLRKARTELEIAIRRIGKDVSRR
jgi:RNA polymerase sigma-70 factor (ECF subfamily)